MENTAHRAIAIVGCGAIMPDAPDVPAFWKNIKAGRYSISDVPPERWDPELYYDPDRSAPDKTYSRIGGWVREFAWDPLGWRLPMPPRVAERWTTARSGRSPATREALVDAGWPERPLNTERTAVILGNAMAGRSTTHDPAHSTSRSSPANSAEAASFAALPAAVRARHHPRIARAHRPTLLPPITEDTMPGELANCLAGRVANLFNFRGPNFTTDAACASALAAISAAVEGLVETSSTRRSPAASTATWARPRFMKFCKIGALSATGTRPYAEGADGFVMGEGAALFVLKRLADAERDGDRSTPCCAAWAGRATARARASPRPTRSASDWRSSARGRTPGCRPATAT